MDWKSKLMNETCNMYRAPRGEDASKREVIQITSHSPSTRTEPDRSYPSVVACPTLSQPSPHPGVVAGVLLMSTTRGQTRGDH
jgi:hypothetical protein